MCGIWGLCGRCPWDVAELFRSFQTMKARGPNSSEFFQLKEVVPIFLGFHRLSIMDLTHQGDQPFVLATPKRTIYCVCNGEIYNYPKLIMDHELVTRSQSDCEVIPLLYQKYGIEKLVQLLRGSEYATVILDLDKSTKEITLYSARDPLGVRPLYYCQTDQFVAFSSEAKGLVTHSEPKTPFADRMTQFPPGHYLQAVFGKSGLQKVSLSTYYPIEYPMVTGTPLSEARLRIREGLIEAVKGRLHSHRPLGAALSGGLDSSLVCAIAARLLAKEGKVLRTFSIGLPGSTDRGYAEKVAAHIGSEHTHIEFTEEEFLAAIPHVIWAIESYDITTVRASTGQYLLSQWIRKHTNIKVLLIGDGSDELCAGYLYFHKAPTPAACHAENTRLLQNIHKYDVLRADRGIAGNSLEARTPFLDSNFVDLYMSIDPKWRVPTEGMEKWLLRTSFQEDDWLPHEVLFRRKEAFSDGVSSVSRSWYEVIQEMATEKYQGLDLKQDYTHLPPPTPEARHYRDLFSEYFGTGDVDRVIGEFWMPPEAWCGKIHDPSARVLDVYDVTDQVDLKEESVSYPEKVVASGDQVVLVEEESPEDDSLLKSL